MLWLKAFHVIAVVTWFAGLFYLPRLFVYHADATDAVGIARFKVMEKRLFALMSIGGTASVLLGIGMLVKVPAYVTMLWLLVKLCIVLLVIIYHSMCFKYLMDFRHDRNVHSSRWFRGFNEIPSVLLVAIVILAVVKPSSAARFPPTTRDREADRPETPVCRDHAEHARTRAA